MRLNDGEHSRIVSGALIFNPLNGRGKVINIVREISIDYSVDEIENLEIKPYLSKRSLEEVEGPSDEELAKQTSELEELAKDNS
ncbi:hypothetical protein HN604_00935 [archaeon]|jgi:hypothetical protein|nr:hypothetical protein [archaeon]MBT6182573.1 hypothetical protein [archaeon]MBT6606825.1 hypothetical protein [archaeon]MBT7251971.1 hypothetical protein [archaeon]MBT7660628.1 hypothetical protein [archaeon]